MQKGQDAAHKALTRHWDEMQYAMQVLVDALEQVDAKGRSRIDDARQRSSECKGFIDEFEGELNELKSRPTGVATRIVKGSIKEIEEEIPRGTGPRLSQSWGVGQGGKAIVRTLDGILFTENADTATLLSGSSLAKVSSLAARTSGIVLDLVSGVDHFFFCRAFLSQQQTTQR